MAFFWKILQLDESLIDDGDQQMSIVILRKSIDRALYMNQTGLGYSLVRTANPG
jgi:hypothetical protein